MNLGISTDGTLIVSGEFLTSDSAVDSIILNSETSASNCAPVILRKLHYGLLVGRHANDRLAL